MFLQLTLWESDFEVLNPDYTSDSRKTIALCNDLFEHIITTEQQEKKQIIYINFTRSLKIKVN